MTLFNPQDLRGVGTARLEAMRDGLLQVAFALRSVPTETYAPSLRRSLDPLTAALGAVDDVLRERRYEECRFRTNAYG